jgi:hypothetical protein
MWSYRASSAELKPAGDISDLLVMTMDALILANGGGTWLRTSMTAPQVSLTSCVRVVPGVLVLCPRLHAT